MTYNPKDHRNNMAVIKEEPPENIDNKKRQKTRHFSIIMSGLPIGKKTKRHQWLEDSRQVYAYLFLNALCAFGAHTLFALL